MKSGSGTDAQRACIVSGAAHMKKDTKWVLHSDLTRIRKLTVCVQKCLRHAVMQPVCVRSLCHPAGSNSLQVPCSLVLCLSRVEPSAKAFTGSPYAGFDS